MNIKILDRKLNGFERTFRGKFVLLKENILTDNEFILWDLSFSVLADWDKNHIDTYGSFRLPQEQIGYYLNWSKSKVCRVSQELYKKNFWKEDTDGKVVITGFNIKEHLTELAKLYKLIDLQQFIANHQPPVSNSILPVAEVESETSKANGTPTIQKVAKTQQDYNYTLGSSKGNTGLLRSIDEYKEIQDRMGKNSMDMPIDDMIWIDNFFYKTEGIKP